jgi:hypothetical protein
MIIVGDEDGQLSWAHPGVIMSGIVILASCKRSGTLLKIALNLQDRGMLR